ncbi:MAG: hypothetical protein AVDCRST_MAG14-1119 [uncultured Rubrobacteraceae bacterium]|uniref:Uncharacterized protein n=1 Tax=uncultured Rubrobacteraceae bacterium TaxID=349277 RepID=A0A6J4QZI1_9ACTN|nr:MAG: hypothetical protein AVDCRST_MAG14-1119 [uncultured Rubrobacteraceae bacterium]
MSTLGRLQVGDAVYRSGCNEVNFSTHYYLPVLREMDNHHEEAPTGPSITGS